MKCPACKYEHTESYDPENEVVGEHGSFFYRNKGHMRRDNFKKNMHSIEKTAVLACPKCGILFIPIPKEE